MSVFQSPMMRHYDKSDALPKFRKLKKGDKILVEDLGLCIFDHLSCYPLDGYDNVYVIGPDGRYQKVHQGDVSLIQNQKTLEDF